MSTYSNRLQPSLQNLLQCDVRFFHLISSCMTHISADVFGRLKSLAEPVSRQKTCNYIELFGSFTQKPNKFHNYEAEKWFFHPRSSCTLHLMLFTERPPIYVCMTISGGRTKQLDIIAGFFCHVTGFTSDFRPPKTSANIYVVHDDLGWKNQTTRCNRFWKAGCN